MIPKGEILSFNKVKESANTIFTENKMNKIKMYINTNKKYLSFSRTSCRWNDLALVHAVCVIHSTSNLVNTDNR